MQFVSHARQWSAHLCRIGPIGGCDSRRSVGFVATVASRWPPTCTQSAHVSIGCVTATATATRNHWPTSITLALIARQRRRAPRRHVMELGAPEVGPTRFRPAHKLNARRAAANESGGGGCGRRSRGGCCLFVFCRCAFQDCTNNKSGRPARRQSTATTV